MEQFVFSQFSTEDLMGLVQSSRVFNMAREDIEHERVTINSFESEMGSSTEKLDVAVCSGGVWSWLDIDSKMEGYNEAPLGYLLKDVIYDKVLVVIRVSSSLLTDKVKSSIMQYIYQVVPEKYQAISQNKALLGKLAKFRVCLDDSEEMKKSLIDLNLLDEVMKECGLEYN